MADKDNICLDHDPAPSRLVPVLRVRSRRRPAPRWWVTLAGLVGVLAFVMFAVGSLPSWLVPFHERDVDRSSAPLLLQLQNVAQFRAATGTFQVLVDVEHDTINVPSVISGERTTLFATGTVDASVDFSGLAADRVTVSPDRRSVTVALPAAALGAAAVDPGRSRIVGHEHGLLQRVGDALGDAPTDDHELYALAAQKLDAAAQQSDLVTRAEQNTQTMLTGLAGSLGFTEVTVTFDAADPR